MTSEEVVCGPVLVCTVMAHARLPHSLGGHPTHPPPSSALPPQAERMGRKVESAAEAAQRALEEKARLEKEAQSLAGERVGRMEVGVGELRPVKHESCRAQLLAGGGGRREVCACWWAGDDLLPALRDRVKQQLAQQLAEPPWEACFRRCRIGSSQQVP